MTKKIKHNKPPGVVSLIFKLLFPDNGSYTTIGDLEEAYNLMVKKDGRFRAYIWYWGQFFKAVFPLIINSIIWSFAMFNNYFKIALRNIRKQKGYSIIKISSLAIGMACCILMLLWVQDEFSYDNFHKNGDQLYRVIFEKHKPDVITHDARGANATGPALKDQYPEIVDFTRFRDRVTGWLVRYGDKSFTNNRMCVADPSFFTMFTFPFIAGDPETALAEPFSMVISESMAKKYFDNEDPLGKTIKLETADFKVTGVIKDVPANSHIQFDYVFPILHMDDWWGDPLDSWRRDFRFTTFVQLSQNSSWEDVSKKISESNIIRRNFPESTTARIYLQPLKKIHLYSNYNLDSSGRGDISTVYIFIITASCILLIACINYMNLTTARYYNRAKEIGIRKVAGATRKNIITQFFGESILLSFFAFIISILLVLFLLPVFNNLSGKELSINITENFSLILGFSLIVFFTGIISGSYPALFISSLKPVKIIKNTLSEKGRSRSIFRKTLVVIQFTFTIILIIGSIVIYKQLQFITKKDLGFNKENIISLYPEEIILRNFETVRGELLKNPRILSISKGLTPTGWYGLNSDTRPIDWEGNEAGESILILRWSADYDYLNTFGMELKEGRFFSPEFSNDTLNYILNETAVKEMGIESPLGKWFSYGGRKGTIIGILKDFHQVSLRRRILPLLLFFEGGFPHMNIRISPDDIPNTLTFLEEYWKKFVPDSPFRYNFVDEDIESFYSGERKTSTIFKYFTILAVFISCLGLFGLASYMAEQKTKEIGIRKVLGASSVNITNLFSREFLILIIISIIIACPAGYVFMNKWLQNFTFKTNVGIDTFIFSGIITIGIVLITVIYQSIKASTANPVDSLRSE
ncbi:ABC transporter permease [candidate division KSB1 bacterium]